MKDSESLFLEALELFPGGVNSPVRAFRPHPFFVSKAKGSRLYDVEGRSYLDYCLAYGPLIFGHSHPAIIRAVSRQLGRGALYGAPTEAENRLAELIREAVPAAEAVRLMSTGAEATLTAIRLARAYTGRKRLVKFDGCYHGAHDYVLVKAGSGASSLGIPTSDGVLDEAAGQTLVLPFNDMGALEETLTCHADEIACVIMEPVMANSGLVLPEKAFLDASRRLTAQIGAVLIFDEVVTGFRVSLGGAQKRYGVTPDLVTLGKVLGGGLPLSALAGRREIMRLLAPSGRVYQAGTYSGNPLSVAAGIATLERLVGEGEQIYPRLEKACATLAKGVEELLSDCGLEAYVASLASMFQVFFTGRAVKSYRDVAGCDREKFMRLHSELLRRGVFLPPSQFETCFLSTAHSPTDLEHTLEAFKGALKTLAREGKGAT